jgi:hypothetical protein
MASLVGQALKVAGPFLFQQGLQYAAKAGGNYMRWNALQSTHTQAVNTTRRVAEAAGGLLGERAQQMAGAAGEGLGRIIAPTVVFSDQSMEAAQNSGAFMEMGINMVGEGAVQHYNSQQTNDQPTMKITALKIASGVGIIAMSALMGEAAPAIAAGLAIQTGFNLATTYFSTNSNVDAQKKPEIQEKEEAVQTPDSKSDESQEMTDSRIEMLLERPEVKRYLAAKKAEKANAEINIDDLLKEFVDLGFSEESMPNPV